MQGPIKGPDTQGIMFVILASKLAVVSFLCDLEHVSPTLFQV